MPLLRLTSFLLVAAAIVLAGATVAKAETVTLEKPVPVSQKKADKSKVAGRIVAYDEEGFDVSRPAAKRGEEPTVERVKWDELDARTAYAVRRSLIGPKDAAAHVELGAALLGMPGGTEWAEKAFALALKLDSGLKAKIEEVKQAAGKMGEMLKDVGGAEDAGKDGRDGQDAPDAAAAGEGAADRTGPKMVGGVEEKFWGKQGDDAQAAAVAELKKFAQDTQTKMAKELTLHETTYFLFYSDLDKQEAKNWSGLLDRMYAKLGELFGVERKANIWRGKALVFVFQSERDYVKFQALMHQTPAGGSAGMCHTYGDGMVHIAFYRQPKELEFAHVLVHESVHGFIHRYRSPTRVPSWVNEGLAELIATQLLLDKRPNRAKEVRYLTQQLLLQYKSLGGFFDATHIEAWHYPVAEMMTTMLIERGKGGYVKFVNAIKDGEDWEAALKSKMKGSREALVQSFAEYMKVKL